MKIIVKTGAAKETGTGVAGGIDVPFTAIINGTKLEGEVTLLEHEDGRWGSWGSPDHWIDARTLGTLREMDRDECREVLEAIEEAAAPVARRFARARG